MICRKYLKTTKANRDKNEDRFNFQGQSSRSQRKILAHVNLISIGKYFKGMTKHKIKINLKCLKSQSEIQNE